MRNRITFLIAVLALSGFLFSHTFGQEATPSEVASVFFEDFESGTLGEKPEGWFSPTVGPGAVLVEREDGSGQCAFYSLGEAKFANLMRSIDVGGLQGAQVRYSARVRVKNGGRAQLWLRIDYEDESSVLADNMSDRPIKSGKWENYEIVANIEDKPGRVVFGIMASAGAEVWADDMRVENLGASTQQAAEEPGKLSKRGLQNVKAFARLVGYVRYFHPSDEAKEMDWDRFTIEGVRRVEGAKDAKALAAVLSEVFQPVAPTMQVLTAKQKPMEMEALKRPSNVEKLYLFAWLHHGVGINKGVYSSARKRNRVKGDELPEGMPDPTKVFEQALPGGITCWIPLALWGDREGVLPRNSAGTLEATHGESLTGKLQDTWTAADRGTRLGGVILAWNVFQHFYPYFDEVEVDWEAQLDIGLQQAAMDADVDAYTETLERMIASLQDGHGGVYSQKRGSRGNLPFRVTWASGELVVSSVHPEHQDNMAVGDRVVRVNKQAALNYLESLEERISGATLQWKRDRSVRQVVQGPLGESVWVEWKHKGKVIKQELEYRSESVEPPVHALDTVQEVEPGIWYLDMDRATTEEFTSKLDELAQAKGIVFDLRGYPSDFAAFEFFPHLIDETVHSAWWKVPIVRLPDRQDWGWKNSHWTIKPAEPRIRAKLAFLTGGGAISYAESCMAIVEHYKLAEIVGGPTAGTNGNINPFSIPGGYRIIWTGMKVRKHDNSAHHGVGVHPTIPVEPTRKGIREGRDEVLEAGLRAVGGK